MSKTSLVKVSVVKEAPIKIDGKPGYTLVINLESYYRKETEEVEGIAKILKFQGLFKIVSDNIEIDLDTLSLDSLLEIETGIEAVLKIILENELSSSFKDFEIKVSDTTALIDTIGVKGEFEISFIDLSDIALS
jgi:hypothetical protein